MKPQTADEPNQEEGSDDTKGGGPAAVPGKDGEGSNSKGFSMRSQRYKGVYRMPTGR